MQLTERASKHNIKHKNGFSFVLLNLVVSYYSLSSTLMLNKKENQAFLPSTNVLFNSIHFRRNLVPWPQENKKQKNQTSMDMKCYQKNKHTQKYIFSFPCLQLHLLKQNKEKSHNFSSIRPTIGFSNKLGKYSPCKSCFS